jgi:hypothetical protein
MVLPEIDRNSVRAGGARFAEGFVDRLDDEARLIR